MDEKGKYVTTPNYYFGFVLFATICRAFEVSSRVVTEVVFTSCFFRQSGVVASLMGEIKDDLSMSYTLEGIVAVPQHLHLASALSVFLISASRRPRILVSSLLEFSRYSFSSISQPIKS